MIALVDPALTQFKRFLIDPSQLQWEAVPQLQSLGLVDLNRCERDVQISLLPPYPVIGIGDPTHPLAPSLDALVESPISIATLVRQVERCPLAAATTVQLLRGLDGVPDARALALESICYGLLQGSAEHSHWLAARIPRRLQPGHVIVERTDAVLKIVLDRPLARNAIDREMRDQLFEAFTLAALDSEIHLVKLRSTGSVFSMGGDLEEFGTTRDPATAHFIRSRTLPAVALVRCADILDVHAQGACVGAGLEIAAFARRFTASSAAWFQLPELSMGLMPGAGGCLSVPRRIGRQRASLLMLSGRRINADTALRWGLIDAIEDHPPVDESRAHPDAG